MTRIKEVSFFCFLVILFLLVSILSLKYGANIQDFVRARDFSSTLIYVLFLIVSEVIAPVSSLPLLPLAVSVWGSFWAAIITLAGWFIGAVISFWVARRFGKPFIGKLVNLKKLEKLADFVPEKNFFWAVIVLRIFFPVDIFSYVLGLFTKVGFWAYFWGTLIGIIPFGFLFAYGVRMPIQYQLIGGFIAVSSLVLFYGRSRQKILEWIKSGLKI